MDKGNQIGNCEFTGRRRDEIFIIFLKLIPASFIFKVLAKANGMRIE